MKANSRLKLICPAGSKPALHTAVDNGADAVYLGFRNATNARNFPGLNFTAKTATSAINYAHMKGSKVYLALNTYPSQKQWQTAISTIDLAAELSVDALIIADMGLMDYACHQYPDMRIHLSVQGSASNHQSIQWYQQKFGIQRVILPRVLSVAQVNRVIKNTTLEVEVFGFGSLCVMAEGRCALSSYITGESPNMAGVCSPAKSVRWEETSEGRQSRLNGVLIDKYAGNEPAGYPTLCKGRFNVRGQTFYALEEPTSLNALALIPELVRIGVCAIKVEGRQRSPAYVGTVTRILRQAIDSYYQSPEQFVSKQAGRLGELNTMAEGQCHTLGAYHRSWQ